MPSGKKKRKAIRKKKVLEVHHVSVSHEEDLKSQDEKDIDNGDVGLPASHDHHQTFNGECKEAATNDTLSVRSTGDGNSLAEVPILSEEDGSHCNGSVATLERPMSLSNENFCIGIESLKEIPPESQVYAKKLEDEEIDEVLGMETAHVEGLIQISDPLSQEVTEVMDITKSIAQNSEDMNLIVPLASAATETAQIKNTTDSKMILESSSIPALDSNKPQRESLQSSYSVNCRANYGLKRTEDTHVTEYSEKQPLVAPAPRVAERTSWMNCCGILDLFSGSSR